MRIVVVVLLSFILLRCTNSQRVDEKKARQHFEMGVRYMNEGEYRLAVNSFTDALKSFPGRRSCLLVRGYSYEQLNMFDSALVDFSMAIHDTANNCYPQKEIAYCHYRLGNYHQALKNLQNAFNICDDTLNLLSDRCLYNLMLGKYEEVITDGETLKEADMLAPNDYFNLSVANYELRNFLKSKYLMIEYLQVNPDDIEANYYLGLNYLKLNKNDSAELIFKKIIEIRPQYRNCIDILDSLKTS